MSTCLRCFTVFEIATVSIDCHLQNIYMHIKIKQNFVILGDGAYLCGTLPGGGVGML